jgi:hypothetical protein
MQIGGNQLGVTFRLDLCDTIYWGKLIEKALFDGNSTRPGIR